MIIFRTLVAPLDVGAILIISMVFADVLFLVDSSVGFLMASWLVFREHSSTMDENERKSLAERLGKADSDTLREIIREAESFLASQLQAALAADLRAMTLAAVIAAMLAFIVVAAATVIAAEKIVLGLHVVSIIILGGCLSRSLFAAVHAARPTNFEYAGNSPKSWAIDLERGKSLNTSLAEQTAFYARDIDRNGDVLTENHRCIKVALEWIILSMILSIGAEFVLFLWQLAGGGFSIAICDPSHVG